MTPVKVKKAKVAHQIGDPNPKLPGSVWMKNGRWSCKHQRQKHQCKDCNGSAYCVHNKRKSQCKDCNGSSIVTQGKSSAKIATAVHLRAPSGSTLL